MMEQDKIVLPALREDLHLQRGMAAEDGSPTWMIYDALRNRYFKIRKAAFEILSRWVPGMSLEDFMQSLHSDLPDAEESEVKEMLQFLQVNQLLDAGNRSQLEFLRQTYKQSKKSLWNRVIHNYLFIRIPLFRPDRFLKKSWPWVRPLYDPRTLNVIRMLGVVGILMALQQWDHFLATFLYFFSWKGLLFYFATLIFVKSAHELSHAYMAHKQGCRVASIGVAFLVLFPVLYTDTTDAWRLKHRKQKLSITLAGMMAEFHIAMLATFMWALLPDGVIRSAMFFLATTSWMTSLVVNISPFMRFDGYFALSDLSNVENLQPRSFALARWKLREWIFGFNDSPPEVLSEEKKRMFIIYAFGTWIYRFFLFIGIALLVYYFAFKLLGIFLFLVEIIYFVAKPIYSELMAWVKRKEDMRWNRNTKISISIAFFLFVWIFLPWKSTVSAPAVLEVSRYAEIFPARSAQVQEVFVKKGDMVEQGGLLFQLLDDDLQSEIDQAERSLALTQAYLMRLAGSQKDLEQRIVLEQKKKEQERALKGLQDAKKRLLITSPVKGVVAFLEELAPGQYVSQKALLAGIRSEDAVRVVGYLLEENLGNIEEGAHATWIPSLIERSSFGGTLSTIDKAASASLPYMELASDFGGDIATRSMPGSGGDILRPERAIYRIEVTADDKAYIPTQREVGVVHIDSGWHSPLYSFFSRVVVTAIRESGF